MSKLKKILISAALVLTLVIALSGCAAMDFSDIKVTSAGALSIYPTTVNATVKNETKNAGKKVTFKLYDESNKECGEASGIILFVNGKGAVIAIGTATAKAVKATVSKVEAVS